jgi:hypothetical protein
MRSDVIGDFQDPYGAVFGLVDMAVQWARIAVAIMPTRRERLQSA